MTLTHAEDGRHPWRPSASEDPAYAEDKEDSAYTEADEERATDFEEVLCTEGASEVLTAMHAVEAQRVRRLLAKRDRLLAQRDDLRRRRKVISRPGAGDRPD